MSKSYFVGREGRTVETTEYAFERKNEPLTNAPNVVYIVLDDLGFAGLHCFGSTINTPNIDALADSGLRYNNFHTTAVCSATRASLLTGADHHEVGVANLIELGTGTQNGQGGLDDSYATVAAILKGAGYSTFAAGKWHLSKFQNPHGPYDDWPLGKGFERYYGFLSGETDQYCPFSLVRDNSFIPQPKSYDEGYHLSEDITDQTIDLIFNQKNAFPQKPFFLYLAYGAMHTPHHAPKEYIDRYKGKFDEGWDKIREKWFENQKALGIIPENSELTERAPYVKAWDELDEAQKKLYARYMETFAGFLEHTDEQIGRVIDYLKSIGEFDNTVIVFLSDNGASAEGGAEGRLNALSGQDITTINGETEFALQHFDEIGGEYSFPHYPTGWANALNTPFQWYKIWSHEGGTKDPLIISYPKLIKDGGSVRTQYTHVSDITPTVLDIIGIEKPKAVNGVEQKNFSGKSFKYSFEGKDEKSRRTLQIYETFGNRAIYKDGWKAVVDHAFNDTYETDVWELYHVSEDYSEKYDVASEYPEKLRELQDEFLIEAGRRHVFPMLRYAFHAKDEKIKTMHTDKLRFPESENVYKNIFKPFFLNQRINTDGSFYFSADIERRSKSDEGIIFSLGDRFGGFVFYIKDDRLKFVYNSNRREYFKAESGELGEGRINVRFDHITSGKNIDVRIYVNGRLEGQTKITRKFYMSGLASSFRASLYTEVSDEYRGRFEFTGNIEKIVIHSFAYDADPEKEIAKISNIE